MFAFEVGEEVVVKPLSYLTEHHEEFPSCVYDMRELHDQILVVESRESFKPYDEPHPVNIYRLRGYRMYAWRESWLESYGTPLTDDDVSCIESMF